MPKENVHLSIGFLLLSLLIYLMVRWHFKINVIFAFVSSYLFSLFWLSPDLDFDKGSKSLKRWGPLKFLWYPYKEIFKHRGVSHNIFIGPLTRLLYIITPLLALVALGIIYLPQEVNWDMLAAIAAGLWLPDVSHCIVDRISAEI